MRLLTKIVMALVILLICLSAYPTVKDAQQVHLPELSEPDSIAVDTDQIYISERTSIYVYDRHSLRLKRKIGKRGEGPGEFMLNTLNGHEALKIDASTARLSVSSMGKVSMISKLNLKLVRELKTDPRSRDYLPFGSGWVGQGMLVDQGIQYRAVYLFDSDLRRVMELIRVKHHFQLNEGLKLFQSAMSFVAGKEKIFIAWDRDFVIRVYDARRKRMNIIRRSYQPVKVSSEFKGKVRDYLKNHKRYKQIFEVMSLKIDIPDCLPAIETMWATEGKVYVMTYRRKNSDSEILMLDEDGELIKTFYLPVQRTEDSQHIMPYPHTIFAHCLYGLGEMGDEWYLHVTPLAGKDL